MDAKGDDKEREQESGKGGGQKDGVKGNNHIAEKEYIGQDGQEERDGRDVARAFAQQRGAGRDDERGRQRGQALERLDRSSPDLWPDQVG